MDNQKSFGQVFTPENIVVDMLDLVRYKVDVLVDNIDKLSILEPSFGDGAFLVAIVDRLLTVGEKLGLSAEKIVALIDDNVHGIELDEVLFAATVDRLRRLVEDTVGIVPVLPNLLNMDALDYDVPRKFDYVVGNPPYVRIHNIDPEYRPKLKQFVHSSGNSDLYVVFFEKFIGYVKDSGEFVFIAPNSWLRNSSQKNFRRFLVDGKLLDTVVDYGSLKVFKNASTYTAVVRINFSEKDCFSYENVELKELRKVSYSCLVSGELDFFGNGSSGGMKLGDSCSVRNGVATLADKIFIKDSVEWSEIGVEDEVLRNVVKAGRLKSVSDRKILFPYSVVDGVVTKFTVEDFVNFPNAWKYLLEHVEKLSSRSLEKSSEWFLFGRSQSLNMVGVPKIALSCSISPNAEKVDYKLLDEDTVVYSGLIVSTVSGGLSIDEIIDVVSSRDFADYCRVNGKTIGNGWRTFGAPVVKSFLL